MNITYTYDNVKIPHLGGTTPSIVHFQYLPLCWLIYFLRVRNTASKKICSGPQNQASTCQAATPHGIRITIQSHYKQIPGSSQTGDFTFAFHQRECRTEKNVLDVTGALQVHGFLQQSFRIRNHGRSGHNSAEQVFRPPKHPHIPDGLSAIFLPR